jgi:hypothetical protein
VGTNTRGILVSTTSIGVANSVYYFHDLFETAAPSVTPTLPPTAAPTSTVSPSAIPSLSPTLEPSVTPTFPPTMAPTIVQTVAPTVVPSVTPTVLPTQNPTLNPTHVPTLSPSVTPTMIPSAVPTVSPTAVPSVTPTVVATESPTLSPVVIPTGVPSVDPTRSPSVVPSGGPTLTPAKTPTVIPSMEPTMALTTVPTLVPSFRPSALVPTPNPTARSKSAVVVKTDFTMNSVSGTTLTSTSQDTIKQSIADASQTTANNVDLVSVTKTNRRLLSSLVHGMLATASLFRYKVVAEIHFNLIDFPGLNESYVAGTKSKGLMQVMESHEFDRIISYYATIHNVSQLMNNVTASDVTVTTSIIPAPGDSSSGSKKDLTAGEIVGIVVGAVAGASLLTVLVYLAVVQSRSQSEARRSLPMVELDYTPVAISERVARSDNNTMVDITKVYGDSSEKQFDRFKKLQMTTSASPDGVKL